MTNPRHAGDSIDHLTTDLRDKIAGTIHRRICEHSREECIENLGRCEMATDAAMPMISGALDEGSALARLLADALNDAIRTLRELAEKAAGEIPFDDFDLYAEVVDGALDAAAERDALAAKVEALADWHETKADKARRFRIEIDGRNPVMDKAAEVHTDAARRLRAALDEEPQP